MARILVAEDDAEILAKVGFFLRKAGHEVTSTNNGADVLFLLAGRFRHDLLLFDIRMPANGMTVLKHLLDHSFPLAIVMSGAEVDLSEFAGGPVKRFLKKPFDDKQLMAVVESVLGERDVRACDPEE